VLAGSLKRKQKPQKRVAMQGFSNWAIGLFGRKCKLGDVTNLEYLLKVWVAEVMIYGEDFTQWTKTA